MATFKVPPRIAFSDPMSGSLLSVSQTMSLGRMTGPGRAAAAAAGFASSAARIGALAAGKNKPKNAIIATNVFILELPSLLFIFRVSLRIKRFANRLADEDDQNQCDGNGPERRQRQPQFVPVLYEKGLIDQLA